MMILKIKNYNTILTEKQQKYQHYHQVKVISMDFLQVTKYCHLIKAEKIEQANVISSPLSKVFEKQIKMIEDQVIKQDEDLKALKPAENLEIKSVEGLFPKKMRNIETKDEIDEIKRIKQNDLKYETKKYIDDLQQFETIR